MAKAGVLTSQADDFPRWYQDVVAKAELAENGPTQQDLDRIVAKMRSDMYGNLEIPINRASALSHAVLFDGNFDSVYQIPEELSKVTAAQVKAFAAKYLVILSLVNLHTIPSNCAA